MTAITNRPLVWALPWACLVLAGGCANVPADAGFVDVQQDVAARTGMDVRWNQGTDADMAVAARVRTMLRSELTGDQAVQLALLNNRRLQATYEQLMIAQADLVSAGLLRNPVFDAEIKFPTGGGGTSLELALVQDFIDLLYIPMRQRIAGAAFAAARLQVTAAVVDLAGQARSAFYQLQAAQQMLELRRQVLAATEASYDIARRLREAGNTRELDLFTEQVLYEQSKLELRSAEARVLASRERLNRLMGLWGPEATGWTVAARLADIPADDPPADGLETLAVEKSLDLQLGRQAIESAAQSVGLAAPFGFLPEAELGVAAERESDGGWSAGPAFALPIPLFDQGQPAIARAQADLRRARQHYAATAVDVRSRARAARDAVFWAREQATYYQKVILPLRQKIVDQTQLQYNAMQVSPLQLLQARQQQIDSGAAYVGVLQDYWLARQELDQLLLGRMSPERSNAAGLESSTSSPAASRGGH